MYKKKLSYYNLPGNFIIRLMVGFVFLSEGIEKLLMPVANGPARFAKLGVPYPQVPGPFVGAIEITCGFLLIIGLLTRIASFPLLIVMLVTIYTTKIPTFIQKGFWAAAHDGRADFCMLMGLTFLLIYGAANY